MPASSIRIPVPLHTHRTVCHCLPAHCPTQDGTLWDLHMPTSHLMVTLGVVDPWNSVSYASTPVHSAGDHAQTSPVLWSVPQTPQTTVAMHAPSRTPQGCGNLTSFDGGDVPAKPDQAGHAASWSPSGCAPPGSTRPSAWSLSPVVTRGGRAGGCYGEQYCSVLWSGPVGSHHPLQDWMYILVENFPFFFFFFHHSAREEGAGLRSVSLQGRVKAMYSLVWKWPCHTHPQQFHPCLPCTPPPPLTWVSQAFDIGMPHATAATTTPHGPTHTFMGFPQPMLHLLVGIPYHYQMVVNVLGGPSPMA